MTNISINKLHEFKDHICIIDKYKSDRTNFKPNAGN